jgi:hypothetical protein
MMTGMPISHLIGWSTTVGKLSPHWLIGVPLEYDDGCNDDWTDEGPEEPPVDAEDGGQVGHLLNVGEELAAPVDPRHLHYLLKDNLQLVKNCYKNTQAGFDKI